MKAPVSGRMLLALGTILATLGLFVPATSLAAETVDRLRAGFRNPPVHCRPHTRWWWMGSATTKEDLTWELAQMHRQGIGGVEQISMQPVYEKGNVAYLSPAYFDLLIHAIREAKKRAMHVSVNFGGPGWIIGGAWVPPEERNQNMLSSSLEVAGPGAFSGELPTDATLNVDDLPRSRRKIGPADRLVAVVAGRIVSGRLQESSLVDLSARANGGRLTWQIPAGRWRLMAFWLTYPGQSDAVDHFSKTAMQNYCDTLGGKFRAAFGSEFGATVDSLFCDSFEVPIFRNAIYWSPGLLEQFKASKGYDLTRYLPALWWDVETISAKIRFDVNEFLHEVALESFFKTFLDWCAANGVKGRIQPYGLTTDILEGAGLTHVPEMEITAGEKDAVPWFDTRIGPKKYVASGAHLYGRNVVSVEAYTYLHWQPYRATLEELKIASDGFLRCGANKFYNHGYTSSPERDIAPSRRFGSEILISPPNTWWKYYGLLSDYVARCCYMLRQGDFCADVAIYSPLANQWTRDVLNARKWTRSFDWGDLGKLLVANGYDFDLLNDDVLQSRANIDGPSLRVGRLQYWVLLLPNVQALPLESMRRIQHYARQGGVVIALERVPDFATGFREYRQRDQAVREIATDMFRPPQGRNGTGAHEYGAGRTYFIKRVIDRSDRLDQRSSLLDPFVNTLRRHVPPDFALDFVREGWRENRGLSFVHRRLDGADLYFVANIQDRPVRTSITFRVQDRTPWRWEPRDGSVARLLWYQQRNDGTLVPLRLAPYESTLLVFTKPAADLHVVDTNFAEIVGLAPDAVDAIADQNGNLYVTLVRNRQVLHRTVTLNDLPAPLVVSGKWHLVLEGRGFPQLQRTSSRLTSWTEESATRHFSGTGRYAIDFRLPDPFIGDDRQLQLDLGQVGNVAEVRLNGTDVGTRWMRGQLLDISGPARPGINRLVVLVTNTLINRVSGLGQPPPVPNALVPRYGCGLPPAAGSQRGPIGFQPLPASGLMGPVRILARKRVVVAIE